MVTKLDQPSLATTVAAQLNMSALVRSDEYNTLYTVPNGATVINILEGQDKNDTMSVNTALIGTGLPQPVIGAK